MLLGNYNGIPTHTVSILEGLKKEFAGDTINFMAGTRIPEQGGVRRCRTALLTTDGKPGVKATYLNENIVSFASAQTNATQPLATRD